MTSWSAPTLSKLPLRMRPMKFCQCDSARFAPPRVLRSRWGGRARAGSSSGSTLPRLLLLRMTMVNSKIEACRLYSPWRLQHATLVVSLTRFSNLPSYFTFSALSDLLRSVGGCKARKCKGSENLLMWVSTRHNSRDIHRTRIALYSTRGIGPYTYLSACITPCTVRSDCPLYFRTLHTYYCRVIYTDCTYGTTSVSLRAVRSSNM